MQKQHIITISGKPGSGKSSTADRVAELLSYTRYSSGDFVREIIRKHGLTLAEFNQKATENHEIDHEIDEELRKLREQKDIVIDSRLGFYWIPESFKVYLDLDIDVATARIYKDSINNQRRSSTESGKSITEVQKLVQARLKNEKDRFRSLYGVDPYKRENFDLIINTARQSPESVSLAVYDNYVKWLKTDTWKQVVNEVPLGFSLQ
ncbi:cytidylate kinase family protein [Candidatus Kaiserbacteria bacterium]|nr:cytidylate kinase family protein [Candidatus Kaiserbacteria bacterium]